MTPKWNQKFDCFISDIYADVTFECWDAGAAYDTLIGATTVKVSQFVKPGWRDEEVTLYYDNKSVGVLVFKSLF